MSGKKLLVADDSLTIQKVIRLALSNEGYEIQAVSDGNDAVQQISLFRPDAVLIDVSLPSKSAFEVKRAINEHADLEEVRFILMSSAFEKVDEAQAEEVVFHGRLTKPFDPAHLRQVLAETLAQVAAKRMEPTSLLTRPPASMSPPEPPAALDFDSESLLPPPTPEPQYPIMPPPPMESSERLWDEEEEPTRSTFAPPPPSPSFAPPPPPVSLESDVHSSERDADIKHLTESTIRMSGLDDFQWSVSEPSLKPSSNFMDTGGASFDIEHAPRPPSSFPPFKPDLPESYGSDLSADIVKDVHDPVDDSSTEIELDTPTLGNLPPSSAQIAASSPTDFYREGEGTRKITRPPAPPASGGEVVGIPPGQVEDLLRAELRKLLPDLAERIIKQEIHKMLSDSSAH